MEKYIIEHKDGGYLYKNKAEQWDRTPNIELAERMKYDKAHNVLNNCIAPTMRPRWMIVEDHSQYYQNRALLPAGQDSLFDWQELSRTQHTLYHQLFAYQDELRGRLSAVDLEICDIQHYIEFFSLDAAKGYKAYKMLRERLERRRFIKDELAKINYFLTDNSGDFSSGKIINQIKGLDNCVYRPRILSELFGLEGGCRTLPHIEQVG